MTRTWAEVKAEMQDTLLTRLLNIQPCREGDHEAALPCPHCGAAI